MRSLFMLLILLSCGKVFAQAPDTLWTRTYGGGGSDYAGDVCQTSDGGFAIIGSTFSFGAGSVDMYLVRTNGIGDTLWTRTYGGTEPEAGYSVEQTNDGGFILAGETSSFGAGSGDMYVVKTNSLGDTLWTRTYGGATGEVCWSVRQTPDSGFILAGYTESYGAGDRDFYLVKTNSQGDTLWTRTYGSTNREEARSLCLTMDGGYALAGFTDEFNQNIFVVRSDSHGDTLWTKSHGGFSWEQARSIIESPEGGFVIAGFTFSISSSSVDCYAIKVDHEGDTLWTRTIGGSGEDWFYEVVNTFDGGYAIAGFTGSFGAGYYDVFLAKLNDQGNEIWTLVTGFDYHDECWALCQSDDGSYVMAGYTYGNSNDGQDFFLVRTEPDPCFEPTPAAPNVVIQTLGLDVHLNWSVVDTSVGGCPVSDLWYAVFYAPTSGGPFYYHGWTPDTSYTHFGVVNFSPTQFYQVVAVSAPMAVAAGLVRGEEMESGLRKIRTAE